MQPNDVMEVPPGWQPGIKPDRIFRSFGDALSATILRVDGMYIVRVQVAEADIRPPRAKPDLKSACDQALTLVWGFADNALRDANRALAQAGIDPFEFRAKWRGSNAPVKSLFPKS